MLYYSDMRLKLCSFLLQAHQTKRCPWDGDRGKREKCLFCKKKVFLYFPLNVPLEVHGNKVSQSLQGNEISLEDAPAQRVTQGDEDAKSNKDARGTDSQTWIHLPK